VCHDTIKKNIIPVVEFLTTSNNQITIGNYLSEFKLQLSLATKTNVLPKIIVTDMGWALINSVLRVFNNCSMMEYLNWCYNFVFKNQPTLIDNVVYYTCSTHFIKNIIKKAKGILNFSNLIFLNLNILIYSFLAVTVVNKVKRAFVFAFALIQNSTAIDEIDLYLHHIYIMFNSFKLTGRCMQSIFIIGNAIRGTELSNTKILEKSTPDERRRDEYFDKFLEISNSKTNDNKPMKVGSPFHEYYEKKIQNFKDSYEETNSPEFHQNEFYSPKLFDILRRQLYLLPIWSGIIIYHQNFGYDVKTRLSNNPVENWIGQLKNNVLKEDNIVNFKFHIIYNNFIILYTF
jgi:hypothetical protein